MILCGSLSGDLLEIVAKSSTRSLNDLARVPVRRFCGDPGDEAGAKGSVHDFVQAPTRRSCCDPGILLRRRVFAWSCTIPFGKILWSSCWNHLMDLCMILYRSLWEDLAVKAKGPCIQILKMLCVKGACMQVLLGCSQEVLAWRSWKYSLYRKSLFDNVVTFCSLCWFEIPARGPTHGVV